MRTLVRINERDDPVDLRWILLVYSHRASVGLLMNMLARNEILSMRKIDIITDSEVAGKGSSKISASAAENSLMDVPRPFSASYRSIGEEAGF